MEQTTSITIGKDVNGEELTTLKFVGEFKGLHVHYDDSDGHCQNLAIYDEECDEEISITDEQMLELIDYLNHIAETKGLV